MPEKSAALGGALLGLHGHGSHVQIVIVGSEDWKDPKDLREACAAHAASDVLAMHLDLDAAPTG